MKCNDSIEFGVVGEGYSAYSFFCQLTYGHPGPHQQTGIVQNGESKIHYTIQWSDPREKSKLFIPEIKVDQRILVSV